MGKFAERRVPRGPGPVASRVDHSSKLALQLPALWEYLTLCEWEDGKERETASLTVFFGEGLLKACISDKDAGLVAFVSGESLEGLLQALERGLAEGTLDWRRQREAGGGRSRKGG